MLITLTPIPLSTFKFMHNGCGDEPMVSGGSDGSTFFCKSCGFTVNVFEELGCVWIKPIKYAEETEDVNG